MSGKKQCDKHPLGPVHYDGLKCPLCRKLEEAVRKEYEHSGYEWKPRVTVFKGRS